MKELESVLILLKAVAADLALVKKLQGEEDPASLALNGALADEAARRIGGDVQSVAQVLADLDFTNIEGEADWRIVSPSGEITGYRVYVRDMHLDMSVSITIGFGNSLRAAIEDDNKAAWDDILDAAAA